jgi:CRISPR-associated protein Csb2
VDALLDRHHAFVNRLHTGYLLDVPPLKESAFRVVGYRRVTDVRVSRAPVAFKLLEADTDRFATFSLTEANSVAAMMRHATATAARHEPKEWVDAYVHGHQPDGTKATPRFSYLPLPSIEQRGRGAQVMSAIRRLLLAELVEAPESYLSWARRRLPGEGLIEEGSAAPAAILAPLSEGDWVLRQYTRASENWASATPVVLPGSDEGKLGKAKKLLAKALRHAGYCPDALAEAEFRNESFWPGGSPALRFRRPEYLKKGCWSVYHLRLRWHRPVSGPIALGAGRHCGLGVFASLDT